MYITNLATTDTCGEFSGMVAEEPGLSATMVRLPNDCLGMGPLEEPDHVATSPGDSSHSGRDLPRRPGALPSRRSCHVPRGCQTATRLTRCAAAWIGNTP